MRIVVKDGIYHKGKVRILAKVFPEREIAWQADGNNRMNPQALLTIAGDFTPEECLQLARLLEAAAGRESTGGESGVGNELSQWSEVKG